MTDKTPPHPIPSTPLDREAVMKILRENLSLTCGCNCEREITQADEDEAYADTADAITAWNTRAPLSARLGESLGVNPEAIKSSNQTSNDVTVSDGWRTIDSAEWVADVPVWLWGPYLGVRLGIPWLSKASGAWIALGVGKTRDATHWAPAARPAPPVTPLSDGGES